MSHKFSDECRNMTKADFSREDSLMRVKMTWPLWENKDGSRRFVLPLPLNCHPSVCLLLIQSTDRWIKLHREGHLFLFGRWTVSAQTLLSDLTLSQTWLHLHRALPWICSKWSSKQLEKPDSRHFLESVRAPRAKSYKFGGFFLFCVSILANGGICPQEKYNIVINKPVNMSLYVYALWNSVCNLYLLVRKKTYSREQIHYGAEHRKRKNLNSRSHTCVIRRWPGGVLDTKSDLFRRVTCPIDYRRPADWACRDIKTTGRRPWG